MNQIVSNYLCFGLRKDSLMRKRSFCPMSMFQGEIIIRRTLSSTKIGDTKTLKIDTR